MATVKKKIAGAQPGSRALSAVALAKLASSGLTAEDAGQLGMTEVLASEVDQQFPSIKALRLPYHDLNGQATGFYRLRYLELPSGFAGQVAKPQRYAQAAGTLNHVYLPRLADLPWAEIAADPTIPLLITEGELKAACACKHGFPTLGLGGVTVWQSGKKQLSLLPPLEDFEWQSRPVYIVFDSDAATNPQVAKAQLSLATRLLKLGAVPLVATLPSSSSKVGLDDFLLARGNLDEVLADSKGMELAGALAGMNEEFVFVGDQDVVLRLANDSRLKRDSLVNGLLANRRQIIFRRNSKGEQVRAEVSVPGEWLKWPARRTVNSLVYEPGAERFVGDDYNLWRSWGVAPVAGEVASWLELLDFLFDGAAAERRWFEQWCAYPLQHPGTKLYSAAVLWGPETGTGKSLVGYTLGRIYGDNFVAISNQDLHANFNEWAVGKQFVLGDEITGSDRRSEADKLKQLITQLQLRINMKHLPTYEVRDCLNYYFTSNHPDAFFLDDQDRRYFIHRVPNRRREQEFYRNFVAWLDKQNGASHLFHHLLHVDLTGFDPTAPAFETSSRLEMVDHCRSDVAEFVADLLRNLDSHLKRLAALLHLTELPDLVLNKHLRQLYDPEGATRVTANGLARELSRFGVKSLPSPIKTKAFGAQRFYILRNTEKWLNTRPDKVCEYLDQVYQPVVMKERKF